MRWTQVHLLAFRAHPGCPGHEWLYGLTRESQVPPGALRLEREQQQAWCHHGCPCTGPMRDVGTSGLPRAHTMPTTHSACLGHKGPLSPGQRTQPYLSPRDYKGHTARAYGPLGRSLRATGWWPMLWPQGPFIVTAIEAHSACLFSYFVLRQSLPV